ncbi:diacylglycerol kinase family protein [Arenibacter sp. ARW7G5Y1]|uniref:diacylglycerol/lipid kinase family protein n=1 Tax=Arenibacter sp. ARW7G5Y1 TaxID=2135619 RepID=UPI000D7716EE|nr:diacylglycerol kinase family protein [Arenibacter sp. ARW7G5Y1]PXX30705.1 YegS/Rv2252/BmrU family lipid kinase [Arenibacter sp. ARW7G5Y1]
MRNIHFIINPKAGSGNNFLEKEFLRSYFKETEYLLYVKYSKYKKQAISLTKDSIKEGAQTIVACGGDGTINEVASCLVGTNIMLGIIPIGSGNGLASNLMIPHVIEKAIEVIKRNEIVTIDVGRINEQYFFSNTGMGFDANVIKNYEALQKRTILGYLKASLRSFKEYKRERDVRIIIDGGHTISNPFLVFISNSNELGFKISLTPKASLMDGQLDVIIVPELSRIKMLLFGVLMLTRRYHWLKEVKTYQTKTLQINRKGRPFLESQIDGEFHKVEDTNIHISVLEKSLGILAPKNVEPQL